MLFFTGTLLVVESVGVHIENVHILHILKNKFGIFTSIEFLSWNMIEDIFINEVIKGVSSDLFLFIHKIKTKKQTYK